MSDVSDGDTFKLEHDLHAHQIKICTNTNNNKNVTVLKQADHVSSPSFCPCSVPEQLLLSSIYVQLTRRGHKSESSVEPEIAVQ